MPWRVKDRPVALKGLPVLLLKLVWASWGLFDYATGV